MKHSLLILIYVSFISLGLPDSLLGSAWPVMYQDLKVPLSFSGIIYVITTLGTVTSSLSSEKLINKFGTGKVTFISVLLTAIGMLGYSFSPLFILLCIWAIPYGLGAGSVDTALNNYVALYYESKHMSWLHCMWGVGASIGPYIMSFMLKVSHSWKKGYRVVAFLQFGLTIILFLCLPLWNKKKNDFEQVKQNDKGKIKEEEKEENVEEEKEEKVEEENELDIPSNNTNTNNNKNVQEEKEKESIHNENNKIKIDNTTDNLLIKNENSQFNNDEPTLIDIKEEQQQSKPENKEEVLGLKRTIRLPGAKEAMIYFFSYCALEQTVGLWTSSYLVLERHVPEVTAAVFASLFYIGITVGRAISGFITLRLNDNQMIYLGEGIIGLGIVMILLPFSYYISLVGFITTGLGCAPLFPCMIHATPENFGKDKSQAVIGVQMASGSLGVLMMPAFFGMISKWIGIKILPFYLGIFLVLMIVMHFKIIQKNKIK